MKKQEKPSEMYERLARQEENERLPYEREMASRDGQRSARQFAKSYRRKAAEARATMRRRK